MTLTPAAPQATYPIPGGVMRRWLLCRWRGHSLMCVTDGHICTRCGTFWRFFQEDR